MRTAEIRSNDGEHLYVIEFTRLNEDVTLSKETLKKAKDALFAHNP